MIERGITSGEWIIRDVGECPSSSRILENDVIKVFVDREPIDVPIDAESHEFVIWIGASDGWKRIAEDSENYSLLNSTDFVNIHNLHVIAGDVGWFSAMSKEVEMLALKGAISLDAMFQVLKSAKTLIPSRMPTAAVVPTRLGAVELEWRKALIHLRLVFDGRTIYVWMDNLENGDFVNGGIDEVGEILPLALQRMSEH